MPHPLQYPIGQAAYTPTHSAAEREGFIASIAAAPHALSAALTGLSDEQMNVPYRDGGWTIRQIAHHIADSHANAYIRFKLALTEDQPVIKPYAEERWAELPDTAQIPVSTSVVLLGALHERWTALLRAMTQGEFERSFVHPDSGTTPLDKALQLYVWHGAHHTAQIAGFRAQQGW
jgi:uncharacterized damage-inducible protein DinB